jgi:chromosome segregation ATPase
MIAEGPSSSTHGGEPPRSERDLLAARRAAQAGEDPVLLRRAEAAEATVQTLETHLSSLRQRLREAEEERRHGAQRLAASENELRRVKQQEYAEQQLRVEAERALAGAVDRSADALARSEAIRGLRERVSEVERRAAGLSEQIESERAARERTERELEAMRESHAAMAVTVSELRDVARKLRDAAAVSATRPSAAPAPVPAAAPEPASQARREEMADALAAAVERLRARAEEALPASSPAHPASSLASPASPAPPVPSSTPESMAGSRVQAPAAAKPKSHKHSMSLIGRLRAARKHRREGR